MSGIGAHEGGAQSERHNLRLGEERSEEVLSEKCV